MTTQRRIPVPRQVEPDPKDYECEWCGCTASVLHRRRAGRKWLLTQQYVFTCHQHQHLGEQSVGKRAA